MTAREWLFLAFLFGQLLPLPVAHYLATKYGGNDASR